MRKLGVAEYISIGWPMALGAVGAAGGTLGGLSFLIGLWVMKSDRPLSRRYLLTGLCSLAAAGLTALLAD